jgi:hypothetical protein
VIPDPLSAEVNAVSQTLQPVEKGPIRCEDVDSSAAP